MRNIHLTTGAKWLLVGIGVLVGLTVSTLASPHASPANRSEVTGMPSAHESSTPLTGPRGVPAITPYPNLAANAASVVSGGTATLPTFTADDARAWVTAHMLPTFQQAYGTVTINSVTFLPSEQASQWQATGSNQNLPVGTPLCVVVLDGSFPGPSPRHWPASLRGSAPPEGIWYSHTVLGFNGVTGNLLFRSATSSLPPALAAAATPTS
jgi:hypothetical protein